MDATAALMTMSTLMPRIMSRDLAKALAAGCSMTTFHPSGSTVAKAATISPDGPG